MTPAIPELAPVLDVEDLTVEFVAGGGLWTPVVDGVSFQIGPQETVGLVGESGSGKSVTCLALLRLLPVGIARISGGAIRLEGQDLALVDRRLLEDLRGRRISMVFQEPMTSLNPAFTVGDQVAEVLRRHLGVSRRLARSRTVEMFERVGIPGAADRLDRYPHEFSGGMRQRVMIAMALVCDPALLIADEPTTALDVTVQAQVLELLKDLSRDLGTSVLFVTHDLGVVAELCDRVVVMYAGQVIESASVNDLFERPRHPYTEGLLRSAPQLVARRSALAFIPGQPPRPGEIAAGCRYAPRCAYALEACHATEPELTTTADGHGVRCLRTDELSLQAAL